MVEQMHRHCHRDLESISSSPPTSISGKLGFDSGQAGDRDGIPLHPHRLGIAHSASRRLLLRCRREKPLLSYVIRHWAPEHSTAEPSLRATCAQPCPAVAFFLVCVREMKFRKEDLPRVVT